MNSEDIFLTGTSLTFLSMIYYFKTYKQKKPILILKDKVDKMLSDNSFDYIFDVRTKEEYDRGNYKDAIHFHIAKINKKSLEKYDKNKKYLLYCRSGRRAKVAADTMKANGFKYVYYINYTLK